MEADDPMARGKFITFEGGEGAGKSTQARRLAARLGAAGHATLVTREPGGSPFAEQVRALILDPSTAPHGPLSEAFLFSAARADHLERTILPALARGTCVISDRFADSTRVYQGAAGGLDVAIIDTLERLAVGPHAPDLTFILDLAPETGLARATARRTHGDASDAFEARDLAFHQRLREGFLAVARAEPGRCVVVDGALGEAEIAERVWQKAAARLALGRR